MDFLHQRFSFVLMSMHMGNLWTYWIQSSYQKKRPIHLLLQDCSTTISCHQDCFYTIWTCPSPFLCACFSLSIQWPEEVSIDLIKVVPWSSYTFLCGSCISFMKYLNAFFASSGASSEIPVISPSVLNWRYFQNNDKNSPDSITHTFLHPYHTTKIKDCICNTYHQGCEDNWWCPCKNQGQGCSGSDWPWLWWFSRSGISQ